MSFKWETQKEKINRFIKMSPKEKLEWLRQMQEFTEKYSSKSLMKIRRKLRESR